MANVNVLVTPERFSLVCGVNEDCTIELANVGYDAVIFRLLTTSPERYVVKHTKGLIRGNSAVHVTISLNAKHLPTLGAAAAPAGRKLTDEFRLEYARLSERDSVDTQCSNVPALIKSKRAEDPTSVHKKMLRCSVVLDAARTTTAAAPTGARGGAADAPAVAASGEVKRRGTSSANPERGTESNAANVVSGGRTLTRDEMELRTLEERRRRGVVAQKQSWKASYWIVISAAIAAILALFVMTM